MINASAMVASSGRNDLSKFIVHLTRNDKKDFSNGNTARENFLAIIEGKTVCASRAHCLFNKPLKDLPKEIQEYFFVSCFTETPLSQVHRLIGKIPGRRYCFEPYGLIFTREFILEKGGEPAIYVNGFGQKADARRSASELFKHCKKKEVTDSSMWGMLPYINIMYKKYDFYWEREWRMRGDLPFRIEDIYGVILPASGEEQLEKDFRNQNVRCFKPKIEVASD